MMKGIWVAARDMASAALTAQVMTAPITCSTFGELSLVGVPANLALGSLFGLEMGVGVVACLLIDVPLVGGAALALSDLIGTVISALLRWLSSLPFASVMVEADAVILWGALLLGEVSLLVVWPRVRRRVVGLVIAAGVLVLGCLLVRWRYFSPARVCVLDVGQGDAILVQDGSTAVLVDAGPDDSVVRELTQLHVMHLDAVVVTHLHDDHYGGLKSLGGRIPCDNVVVAEGVAAGMVEVLSDDCSPLDVDAIDEVALGDTLRVGDFVLEVVWPEGEVTGSENCDSIELALDYRSGDQTLTGLLTGDAERNETGAVLDAGRVGTVDFLKVGHHGSKVSLASEQCSRLSPLVAVASAGEGNRYGHPSSECKDLLVDAGSTFLCTMDCGTVSLLPANEGVRVVTERPYEALGNVA